MTTNASGIATVGSWTLGTTAGVNTLTATSPGLTGSPVTFTATGIAGAATKYVVVSSNYSPPVSSPVTIIAQLADQYNNPVATGGLWVTFTRSGTGGSFGAPNPAQTNASGVATITFTTGTTVGAVYTVTATSSGPTRTGTSPAITTIAATPTTIALNAGNNQTAAVNTTVATAPSVRVTDAYGNPVSGVVVTFAVASGGGSVTGASATTNASGIATVGSWSLGTTAGANTLTAICAGLTGSPVTFTATGAAGPAAKYIVTAGNYNPDHGTAVTLTAQLTDQYNNPVATSGLRVRWSKTGKGGVVHGDAHHHQRERYHDHHLLHQQHGRPGPHGHRPHDEPGDLHGHVALDHHALTMTRQGPLSASCAARGMTRGEGAR